MNNQGHRVAFSYTAKGGKRSPQTRAENKIKILKLFIKNLKTRKNQVNSNANRASFNRKIKNAEKELRRILSETHKAITAHYINEYVKLYSPVFRQAERAGHVTTRRGRGA